MQFTVTPIRLFAVAITYAATGASLSAQSAPAAPATEDVLELSPFQVKIAKDRGYASTDSIGSSRVAMPVGDLSSSIITLNEQFLRDRAAVDAPEALTYVSGVQRTADRVPGQEQFSLRGFALGSLGLRDGLPEPFAAADQSFDEGSAYERLEIIKGPAGTLYGAHSMGGLVNKISKWPKFQRLTRVELQAQSYDEFFRAMVDSTGPLKENLAYRVVLSARTGNRFYDEKDAPNDFNNTTLAFTRLLGKHGVTGKVWGRAQYLDFSLDREQGLQFLTGYLDPSAPTVAPVVTHPQFPLPVDRNAAPEDDVSKGRIHALEGGYERTFNGIAGGDWTVRLVGRYSKGKGDKSPSYAQSRPVPVDAAGAIVKFTNSAGALVNGDNRFVAADAAAVADWRVTQTLRDFLGYNQAAGLFLDLVGDLKTGPLAHKLVTSGSLTSTESERAFFFWAVPNAANTTAVANSFSAINPDFSGYSTASVKSAVTKQFNAFNGHAETSNYSLAFQDNIGLFAQRLIFSLGARYDSADITNDRFGPAASLAANRLVVDPTLRQQSSTSATTSKIGVVFKPVKGASLFAQRSETFNPITSLDVSGKKNPDQDGLNKEAGLKMDWLDGRLTGTISYFDMELSNVLLQVINPPELGGGFVLRPVGLQKTHGYEIDITAEPLPGLNVMASYSKLSSRDEQGRFFRGVPIDANYGLFTRYQFGPGALAGFAVGASWKHNGVSSGDPTNTFFIDSNDMLDGFISFERKQWSVQLNVYNLADTDDALSTVNDQQVYRALPRNYRLTLRYSF